LGDVAEPRVTLVTSRDLPDLSDDLSGLEEALTALGVDVRIAVWDDPEVDWEEAGLCVVLTITDYADRPEEFFRWADTVPRILNDARVLRWNSDKHYLVELERRGVPTIKTTWLEPDANLSKHQVHTRMPALGDFVVKSSLSSNRHTTGRYTAIDARSRSAAIQHALSILGKDRAALIQRYFKSSVEDGEVSLVFFNGVLSHAVSKEGILQTEADPGNRPRSWARLHEVTREEWNLAEEVRRQLHTAIKEHAGRDHLLIYARIDMLHTDEGLKLLEVNMMDVTLYLQVAPEAIENLANAIAVRAHP
jgi:glutathione synthase/RimK-type ligase-like ATP-grasp enzyme